MSDLSTSRFWDKYILKTNGYKIKPSAAKWYVRHAEHYIKFHNGIRLKHHTPDNIRQYLQYKCGNPRLQEWQYLQIVTALKILFLDVIKVPWANTHDWDAYQAMATRLPDDHATVARDYQENDFESDKPDSTTSRIGVKPIRLCIRTSPFFLLPSSTCYFQIHA